MNIHVGSNIGELKAKLSQYESLLNKRRTENAQLTKELRESRAQLAAKQEEIVQIQETAASYRQALWTALQAGRSLANADLEEQRAYRKLLGDSWLDIQLLFGYTRLGRSTSNVRNKLRSVLAQGIEQANQVKTAPRAYGAQPPEKWSQKDAEQNTEAIRADLEEARMPVYPAKELALRIYLTLQEEREDLAEALTETLRACGVEVLYYDGENTPVEVRQNERYFTQRAAGEPYPALLTRKEGEWLLLSMGTRIKGTE